MVADQVPLVGLFDRAEVGKSRAREGCELGVHRCQPVWCCVQIIRFKRKRPTWRSEAEDVTGCVVQGRQAEIIKSSQTSTTRFSDSSLLFSSLVAPYNPVIRRRGANTGCWIQGNRLIHSPNGRSSPKHNHHYSHHHQQQLQPRLPPHHRYRPGLAVGLPENHPIVTASIDRRFHYFHRLHLDISD